MTELDGLLAHLALDIIAIATLAYVLYFRRYRRRDLFVALVAFNIGLFVAVVVISAAEIGLAAAFGLFAVLAIIRLRSEPFSHTELAYFFLALVLALVNGIDAVGLGVSAVCSVVAVGTAAVVDHPGLLRKDRRTELTLELVFADDDALRRHVEERLGTQALELKVLEIDYVRETTRVAVRVAEGVTPGRTRWEDDGVALERR